MHHCLKKIERFTDKSIPYWLLFLVLLIIVEFFFKDLAYKYHNFIVLTDSLIIFFFVLDLIFKYNRMRKVLPFLKKYWLEIIAVFPFFLLFRLFEELLVFVRFTRELTEGQKLLHGGLELSKLAREERALAQLAELQRESRLFQELGEGSNFLRTERFFRYFRLPRLMRGIAFYEKPFAEEMQRVKKSIWKKAKLHKE